MAEKESVEQANPGYALGQLGRLLVTSESHADPATRERARLKMNKWQEIFSGMLSGALAVGSRTPVVGTPAWATLEVATGGFATGALLAAGPLRPHETARLGRLGRDGLDADAARAVLNASFLDDAGLAEIQSLLGSGCYRIEVPEEGALLVVAWLLRQGHGDAARAILEQLGPFLGRLRFYPLPAERPQTPTAVVHVQTVGEAGAELEMIPDNERALVQRDVLQVWNPLLDRLINLFVETVEGPLPAVTLGSGGQVQRDPGGAELIDGGWPCQIYPPGWRERAQTWLADYGRLRASHRPCRRLERAQEAGTRLRAALARCVADPRSLSGREVGAIRRMLALIAAARGLPDSPRSQALRQRQAQHAKLPTRRERAMLLRQRLRSYPQDAGLSALEPVLVPITQQESQRLGFPAERPLPASLHTWLLRCLDAPIEVLVDKGVIPSGEILARVVPQLSAQVGAAGIADETLRRLYTAIYQAFRRRRSLLLLNLESQVRLHELPWVAAITQFRVEDAGTRAGARRTLTELVRLALTAFPQVILPNKLLQEIRALCDRADVKVPIVEEIAADIFMGEFTEKYLQAAQQAAGLLRGSLYECYYGISYKQVQALRATPSGRKDVPGRAPQLYLLCCELAGEAKVGARQVARNGRILEQAQILTTHNLAPLTQALGLRELLQSELEALAQRCFTFVCCEQQRRFTHFRLRLHMHKNTAYAFRQMIFFLSLGPQSLVENFLRWAAQHLSAQPAEFQQRFGPTLRGLASAAVGDSPGAARFLGWVKEPTPAAPHA